VVGPTTTRYDKAGRNFLAAVYLAAAAILRNRRHAPTKRRYTPLWSAFTRAGRPPGRVALSARHAAASSITTRNLISVGTSLHEAKNVKRN
jgi:hypothetical protein